MGTRGDSSAYMKQSSISTVAAAFLSNKSYAQRHVQFGSLHGGVSGTANAAGLLTFVPTKRYSGRLDDAQAKQNNTKNRPLSTLSSETNLTPC